MPRAPRLFIVDVMAMAFRSFYAFGMGRPLTTKAGKPVTAVFGSAMFLNKLITEQRPDYLVFACDSAEPTFRHQLYPAYKANRTAMPEDLAVQLPDFFRLLGSYGAPCLRRGGLEADDLIGTLAKRLAGPNLDVFIVSGDKDFMQLINDHIFLFIPKKGDEAVLVDRAGVQAKFGCAPEQVVDCLALMGDSSDNVPGVKGIGEKGAAKLIAEFGSLEGIYSHLDQVRNAGQRQALIDCKDMAFLSRQLVSIHCDAEIDHGLTDFKCDPDRAAANPELLALLRELDFRTLSAKVEAGMAKIPPAQESFSSPSLVFDAPPAPTNAPKAPNANAARIPDQMPGYQRVTTRGALLATVAAVANSARFCFDTETTGLDVVQSRPIGISLAIEAGKAWYIPLAAEHLGEGLRVEDVMAAITPLLTSSDRLKIGHNVKFDLQMLANVGIKVAGPFADTMLADWLLNAGSRAHGLDACCLRHLNYAKISTSTLIGPRGEIPMLDTDVEELTRYACEDADLTLRLYEHLAPLLAADGLTYAFTTVEMPLVPILARMERTGIYIDRAALGRLSVALGEESERLTAVAHSLAGEAFNLNSPKQLGPILFERLKVQEELGVKGLKKTKSGYSTDESVLLRLAGHPLPQTLLEYRAVSKLKGTYVDALPQLVNPASGRIHTSFHQTGTATGRLSSSDPNLQNIPIRSALGQEIRRAFRPADPDWVMISADYSQVELRMLAHMAADENLTAAFAADEDIHRSTAARVFGVAPAAVDAGMRAKAKAINFGIIYGMGARRLAAETGTTQAEAADFIERYFASYPGIQRFIEDTLTAARQDGYVRTITGRRRGIEGLTAGEGNNRRDVSMAENAAVNTRIQGSAADLIKLAMIAVDQAIAERGLQTRMLLQVHDELVFEAPRSEAEAAAALVRGCMENAMRLSVPLRVEAKVGSSWLEAH